MSTTLKIAKLVALLGAGAFLVAAGMVLQIMIIVWHVLFAMAIIQVKATAVFVKEAFSEDLSTDAARQPNEPQIIRQSREDRKSDAKHLPLGRTEPQELEVDAEVGADTQPLDDAEGSGTTSTGSVRTRQSLKAAPVPFGQVQTPHQLHSNTSPTEDDGRPSDDEFRSDSSSLSTPMQMSTREQQKPPALSAYTKDLNVARDMPVQPGSPLSVSSSAISESSRQCKISSGGNTSNLRFGDSAALREAAQMLSSFKNRGVSKKSVKQSKSSSTPIFTPKTAASKFAKKAPETKKPVEAKTNLQHSSQVSISSDVGKSQSKPDKQVLSSSGQQNPVRPQESPPPKANTTNVSTSPTRSDEAKYKEPILKYHPETLKLLRKDIEAREATRDSNCTAGLPPVLGGNSSNVDDLRGLIFEPVTSNGTISSIVSKKPKLNSSLSAETNSFVPSSSCHPTAKPGPQNWCFGPSNGVFQQFFPSPAVNSIPPSALVEQDDFGSTGAFTYSNGFNFVANGYGVAGLPPFTPFATAQHFRKGSDIRQ